MSLGFTKLFCTITESTVWTQANHVRLVWITMLAMADRHGLVLASVPGLANRARVTVPETEESLGVFLAPDPYSRTKDNEGRRIAEVDGGWELLNYAKYRAVQSAELIRESKRLYMQRRREKVESGGTNQSTVGEVDKVPLPLLSDSSISDPDPERRHPQDAPGSIQEEQGQRVAYRSLEGWQEPPGLEDEALMAGVAREVYRERLDDLRNGPIGGNRGVFDRAAYVRKQFGKWKVWAAPPASAFETGRRGKPEQPQGARYTGWGLHGSFAHKDFCGQQGLDYETLIREFIRSGAIDTVTHGEADKLFVKFLKGKARDKQNGKTQ